MRLQGDDENPRGGGQECPPTTTQPSIHATPPQPGHGNNSSPPQGDELPGHSLQRDGLFPSQSGETPSQDTTGILNQWSWHQSPQLSDQPHSLANGNLADVESHTPTPHEPTLPPTQVSAAVAEYDKIDRDLEMLQQKLEQLIPQHPETLEDFQTTRNKLHVLKQKLQGRLKNGVAVAQGHSQEPVESAPVHPVVEKQQVTKSGHGDVQLSIKEFALMLFGGWRKFLNPSHRGLKGAAAWLTNNRYTDTVASAPSLHRLDDETASGQAGLDLQCLLEWVSSPDFSPTFACIFMPCHVRSNTAKDLRRHLLSDHQDLFQGSGLLRLQSQLNAEALEVCFGGRVPPFAQKHINGVFHTALLSSRGPMTTPCTSREDDEMSPVTIDTFGIPLKG
ncbi:hypothetical protein KVR01_004043 [Diaporthe batatas]|uniref:uncharacterized protein n=1 Tax=Diaporthe batatas TaxID=748121 RepID=UPI001D04E39E|nr:uncharacterized protein KVR01_004043 [Diaporthe batatas]KAG8165491.1 hypothetical protein KVR01_004043 [Diaporthe batatas]